MSRIATTEGSNEPAVVNHVWPLNRRETARRTIRRRTARLVTLDRCRRVGTMDSRGCRGRRRGRARWNDAGAGSIEHRVNQRDVPID